MMLQRSVTITKTNNTRRPRCCSEFATVVVCVLSIVSLSPSTLAFASPEPSRRLNKSNIMSSNQEADAGENPSVQPQQQSVSADTEDSNGGGDTGGGEVPLLPSADPDADIPTIKLGETIRFEEMGPLIINTDGTTRRISNWKEMSEQEQETAWRRIKKRNAERRAKLFQQLQEDEAEAEAEGTTANNNSEL